MAGERTKLTVTSRERLGTRETKRLRREGQIPGVLYGRGTPIAFSVPERELRRALTGSAGLHSILDVQVDGGEKAHASILKEYQVDPIRGHMTHVDLQEVRLDRPITASVSVRLTGGDTAPGVKEGGVLSQPLREVSIEALPLEVPEHVDVDVSQLGIGDSLRVSDVSVPEGVKLLDDPETVVATVTAPMRAEVEEEAEAAEGEVPEGEAAEGAAEASAEPEAEAAGESTGE